MTGERHARARDLFLAALGALGEDLEPYPEVPDPMDDVA